jgi:hypothetical protein
MWLTLGRGVPNADGVEAVLPELAALEQFAADIRRRLEADGLGGIEGLVACSRRLRAALASIPASEIERIRVEITALEDDLVHLGECLAAVARLKRIV